MKKLISVVLAISGWMSAEAATLVLLYDFNDPNSSVAVDTSGMGNHGQITGAVISSNSCGGHLAMDGVNDFIRVQPSPSVNPTGGLTMAAWYRVTDYSRQRPIIEWNGTNRSGVHMWTGVWGSQWGGNGTGANLVDSTFNANGRVISVPNASAGSWHHLAVTYSSNGSACVYLDGVLRTSRVFSATSLATFGDVFIGMRPGMTNDSFSGLLDEVRIYDGALTSNEVFALVQQSQNCEPSLGQVQVKFLPSGDAASGSKWRLNGFSSTNWQSDAAILTDVPSGTQFISIATADGWTGSSNISLIVRGGLTTVTTLLLTATSSATNTLVLHYDFNQSDGQLILDRSGHGNDGINSNCTIYQISPTDGACELRGTNTYIRVPSSSSLNVKSFTLAAWCLTYDYILQRPIIEWSDGYYTGVHMWMGVYGGQWAGQGTGANIMSGLTTSHVISINDPPPNLWYHLAVTYDQGTGQAMLYLNGVLKKTSSLGVFTPSTAYDIFIGRRPTQVDCWQGLLDEIRVYSGVLTSNEVADLHANLSGRQVMQGGLRCTLSPTNAIKSGARWRIAGQTTWRASGETVNNVLAGNHTVEFKPASGWVTPVTQNVVISTSLVTLAAAYLADLAVSNQLLLHYDFEALDPVQATDISGHAQHGVLRGGCTYDAQSCGFALQLDGTNDHVEVPWSSTFTGSFTLATWFRTADYTRQRPLLEWSDTNALQTGVHMWTGVWGWQWSGRGTGANIINAAGGESGNVISTTNPTPNVWHHLAVTYDQALGTARVYLDGMMAAEKFVGSFVPRTADRLFIGCRPGNTTDLFKGWIDDVRVYRGSLSGSDIITLTTQSNCAPSLRSLSVTLLPDAVNGAGAAWRLTGTTNWVASGATVYNLPPQSHLVEFKSLTNWQSPAVRTANLALVTSASLTGVYVYAGTDTIPPTIVNVFPSDGFISTSTAFQIVVTVTDNVGVARVTIKNAEAVAISPTQFVASVSNIRGSYNSFTIKAWDAAGNQAHLIMNHGQATRLGLCSMWDSFWRVRNPFPSSTPFTWQVVGTSESGVGVASANADTYFVTSEGKKTIQLIVDGQIIDTIKSNNSQPNPNGLVIGSLDSDNDGLSNAQEEIAGSGINDAESRFGAAVSFASGSNTTASLQSASPFSTTSSSDQLLNISWQSTEGSLYTVEASIDMSNWYPLSDATALPGTGGVMNYNNTIRTTREIFLRVKAEKAP